MDDPPGQQLFDVARQAPVLHIVCIEAGRQDPLRAQQRRKLRIRDEDVCACMACTCSREADLPCQGFKTHWDGQQESCL